MAGIVEKLQKMWNPPDDEYDEYYEDEATEPTADSREERDVLGLSAGAHRCLRNAVRDDLIVFLYVPKTLLKAFFRHKDPSLPQ